jgi:beta-galactosidase
MRGGEHGVYDVSGLPVTPYLVPQEMAMHMNTDWVTLHHGNGGLLHAAKQTDQFAFSMWPSVPMQLEAATHREELPAPRRTIFTVYGAVRGVGGIDSWGSDVEPQYRLPADRNYHVQVVFKLA